MPILWNDAESNFLVDERRRRNDQYHNISRRSRTEFWESMSRRIYRTYHRQYTARQCEQRWRNLVRDYTVSKIR